MSKYLVYEPFTPLSKEILKYLKPFRKLKKHSYPGFDEASSIKDWNKVLDKMIFSFEAFVKDSPKYNIKHEKRIEEGLKLFAKFFRHLWD